MSKLLEHIEKVGVVFIILAFLIWMPPLWEAFEIRREVRGYDVRDYFDPRTVEIGNTEVGQPVHLRVDREVRQPFFGSYLVEIRTFPTRQMVCDGAASLKYTPEAKLPEPVTLAWWANNECRGADLPPGDFIVVTHWTVENDLKHVDDVTITVESNPFSILAVSPARAAGVVAEQQELQQKVRSLQLQLESLQQKSD